MSYSLSRWDEDVSVTPEEVLQSLLRGLERTDGFELFFVRCDENERPRLISRIQTRIPDKRIELLSLDQPLEDGNLYRVIDRLPQKDKIDILLITGIEKSLQSYVQTEGYGGRRYYYRLDTVPPILNHLNLQRERFRDDFSICFVFFVPLFALRYFALRAPDFFDWRSGIFEFLAPKQELQLKLNQVLSGGGYANYLSLEPEERQRRFVELSDLTAEVEDSAERSKLLMELGRLLQADNKHEEAVKIYEQLLHTSPSAEAWQELATTLYALRRYEEAIAGFDQAIEVQPQSDIAWFGRAASLTELGQYDGAIEAYQQALAINPDRYDIWFWYGLALDNSGRYQDAIASYTRAIELNPNDPYVWLNRGSKYSYLKDYQKGINDLQQSIKLDDTLDATWSNLGFAFGNLERHEEAFNSYDKATQLNPNFVEAWIGRSVALTRLGRWKEALESANKAIELDPSSPDAWIGQSSALVGLGRWREALESANKAIELNPSSPDAWIGLGSALGQLERHEEAFNSFDKATQLNPSSAGAWIGRSTVLNSLGCCQEASESANKAIELDPSSPDAWNNWGWALLVLERAEEALERYDRFLKRQPRNYGVWYAQGQVLFGLRRYKQALHSYDKALSIKRDFSNAWNGRGLSLSFSKQYGFLKRHDEAIAALDQAIKLTSLNVGLLANKGVILARQGKYDEGLNLCNEAIQRQPTSIVYYDKACCYVLQGNDALALENLRQAIDITPLLYWETKSNPDFDNLRQDQRFQQLEVELRQISELL